MANLQVQIARVICPLCGHSVVYRLLYETSRDERGIERTKMVGLPQDLEPLVHQTYGCQKARTGIDGH